MYEMKPEYYIGIDMIDEEHKQLDQQSRGNVQTFIGTPGNRLAKVISLSFTSTEL